MRHKMTTLLFALLGMTLMWGCGSNLSSNGSSSSGGDGIEDAATLGSVNCRKCHNGEPEWVSWEEGRHTRGSTGSTSDTCQPCHNPLKESADFGKNVIGCEACHGGGQYHWGPGPIPFVKPTHEQCAGCHEGRHGLTVASDYEGTPHLDSMNDHIWDSENPDAARALCSKCHTDEGAKLYRDVDGDYEELNEAFAEEPPLADVTSVDCRTCHEPHREENLLEESSEDRSSPFNTCTNCHQLLDDDDDNKIIAYHDPDANPYGDLGEIITDTHFAEAGDYPGGSNRGQNLNDIAGYVLDPDEDSACADCHNHHSADNTINNDWAASKHADIAAAGAWAHYNWTEDGESDRADGSNSSDRTDCQRCHTTTAAIAYFAANEDGDASDYEPPLEHDPYWKPEMLLCYGCHSDIQGTVRETGPITAEYTNAPYTYPDALGSNICISCHTGRESGESITNDTETDFTDASFINSHYLTAGGTVYAVTGYEYDANYDNVPWFAHDKIGTEAAPDTGENGPCVGCHLSSPQSHTFQPVVKGEDGSVTEITSTVCVACHAGDYALTPAQLTHEEHAMHASLEALAAQLDASGHPFLGHYPYFNGGDWTNGGFYDGKDCMGAAFNYNLLEHDPGAYAHNMVYAKRLIYDAIDYLDDADLNESVGNAIDTLVADGDLDLALADEAKAYLDGDSDTPGVQRP